MAYVLPLRFIKVSEKRSDVRRFDASVCATRIVAMMSTDIFQARKTIYNERKNGTLINAAGSSKAKTAIFLDNGSVVASPLTVNKLMSAIEKTEDGPRSKKGNRIKIFEVEEPEEPSEELSEELSEESSEGLSEELEEEFEKEFEEEFEDSTEDPFDEFEDEMDD